MAKQFTPLEAWHDFYEWGKGQPFWDDIGPKGRAKMYERNAAAKGQRRYLLRSDTIKKILTTYAPDRYRFEEIVYLTGK